VVTTQAHRTGELQSFKVTDNVDSVHPPTHARSKCYFINFPISTTL